MHNYSNQKLTKNNFQHQYLVGANFSNADIYHVNFSGAILIDANFTNAKLSGTNFDGATLINANFTNAKLAQDGSTPTLFLLGSFFGSFILFIIIFFTAISSKSFPSSIITFLIFYIFLVLLTIGLRMEYMILLLAIAFFISALFQIENIMGFVIFQLIILLITWTGAISIVANLKEVIIEALVGSFLGVFFGQISGTLGLGLARHDGLPQEWFNLWREKAWLITFISMAVYLVTVVAGYYLGWSVLKSHKSICLRDNIFYFLPKDTSFFNADLTGVNFTGANLKSVNFQGSQINRTCFSQAKNILLARFDKKVFDQLRAKMCDNNSSLILENIDESGKD